MPGWHVERVGQGPVSSTPKIVVPKREVKRIELGESIVSLPELRGSYVALRSKKPSPLPIVSAHDVKLLRTWQETQPIAKKNPTQTSGHIKEKVGLNASAPGAVGALFLYRLAYMSGALGTSVLIAGVRVGLFGILLRGIWLVLAWYLIRWARPGSDWRMQAARRQRNKAKQEAQQEAAEKEAQRAAEREQLRLQREQKMRELEEIRHQRAEEKRARKARRQAFFQDPFVKIALGFGAIIGLYLLLF